MQELLDFEQEQLADRVFLGWDAPLLESVKRWLLSGENRQHLASTLVVVPTSNSGRRLRLALSEDGGTLSPHVVVPSRLFEVDGVASKQETLWSWIQVLRGINWSDYPHLFRNQNSDSKAGFQVALALARQLIDLRQTLADANATFRDAGYHSPEKERWAELAEIEGLMLKQLGKWNLRDPILAKRDRVATPHLPPGVQRVVLACVPDPTPLAIRALQSMLAEGIPVQILIHAPETQQHDFDAWGVPLVDAWGKATIEFPEWQNRMHLVDSGREAAQRCIRILSEQKTPSEQSALIMCDPTFEAAMQKEFGDAGWPLYHPEGRGLAESGLVRLLRAMAGVVSTDSPFDALRELVKLPGAEVFLPSKTSRHDAGNELDKLYFEHLPETVADARYLASRDQGIILDGLSSGIGELKSDKIPEVLRGWLSIWLEHADENVAKAAEPALVEAVDALERLLQHGENISPDEAFEMLAESVSSVRMPSDRGNTVLDLQGWLEISYDPAQHLVLAGMHEECVPEGSAEDVFLPDSLRDQLGMRDMRARFARDAFMLQAALKSRNATGRVDAVIARFNDAGEARKPSRLLMRQTGEQLAAVVSHLFDESPSEVVNRGAWERDWTLKLPEVENIYSKDPPNSISPSAIKDYLDCPLRFYLKRLLKMKTYDAAKREMDALDFGRLCHDVLDQFGADESIRESINMADIEGYFMAQLDAAIDKRYGKNLSLPIIVQLESARERLRAFAAIQAVDRASGWCIAHTEYQVGGDTGVEWQIAGHPVRMAIDRIDRHEDGKRWRVWDYKTSGKAKNPEQAHLSLWKEVENRPLLGELWTGAGKQQRWSEVQLPMYAAFTQEHFNTGELPQVGYINLPRAVSDVAFCPWQKFDRLVMDSAMGWAEVAVERIREGDFYKAANYPVSMRDWDDFAGLAPDGLAAAFGLGDA